MAQTDSALAEQLRQEHKETAVRKTNFPTEVVELPSKGLLYPEDHPLSNGTIEMKYMTAREEDILTSSNLIKQGVVLDKLLQSLIVTPVNYNDILNGDKNAIMVAGRVLGYGKDYQATVTCPDCDHKNETVIDLTEITNKPLDESSITRGLNEFEFELPTSKRKIKFKVLTHGDEKQITSDIKVSKKLNKSAGVDPTLTTRLINIITSVDGETDKKIIKDFVNNELFAVDSRALRKHISNVSPDIDLTFHFECEECGHINDETTVPMGVGFFWPRT
jgi:hypothetical protein